MTNPFDLDTHPWYRAGADAWVRRVVGVHFHPRTGSPYWIRKADELGLDPPRDLQTAHDLLKLGPMDTGALRTLPVQEFCPASLWEDPAGLICVESSGTTGPPATACFSPEDFAGSFVASFRPVAEPLGFPCGGSWLFIGPTGPHAIGRAARAVAAAMGSPEPFCVDFDPRWARKLPEDSIARRRYMLHLIDQAAAIMKRGPIDILFATPPALLALAERAEPAERARVRGIHFGGMEVTVELRQALRAAFPGAVLLSGYGNSLFGVALEMGGADDRDLDYFPVGPRHIIRIVKEGEGRDQAAACGEEAAYGEEGRIVMSRLDLSGFYPNVLERDIGIRVPASAAAQKHGFLLDGVRNPRPRRAGPKIRTGFY